MSLSTSSSHSGLNRKFLKRPDGFTAAFTGVFDKVSERSTLFVLILGVLLAVSVAIGFYLNHRDAKFAAARNSLYLAGQSLQTELKALDSSKNKPKTDAASESDDEITEFKKLDVDAQFPTAVSKLKAVQTEYDGTRSAYEARLKLGSLYFNHGDFSNAVPWYEKAVSSAPSSQEKAMALSALGYAQEGQGKTKEALDVFQKAYSLGEGILQGDLLLGIARCYEALHDSANARSTYDKILTQLPNTEFSKTAELYKDQL